MAPFCSKVSNELRLPLGTRYKIIYKSKRTAHPIKEAKICPGPGKSIFFALFEEDDVDWKLVIDNRSCYNREVCTTITTRDERSHAFTTEKKDKWELETLVSTGKKFHFALSSSSDGQALISAAARKRGIIYSKAEVILSRMKLTIEYGLSDEEIKCKPFEIYLKTQNPFGDKWEFHKLMVTGSTTVASLKELIKNKLEVFPYEQKLLYKQKPLEEEDRNVYDYGINSGETVILHITSRPAIPEIFIRTIYGSTYRLSVMLSDTIETIKHQIQDTEGIPPSQQRLIFDSKQLEDSQKLSFYNIKNKSNIHYVPILRGGGCDPSWEIGERGVICFGKRSMQEFEKGTFTPNDDIPTETFFIEFRMVSKYD